MELRRIRLPFLRPFETALGVSSFREVVLVRLTTPESEGWGECGALSAPLYTAEYAEAAAHVLRHHLVPRLLAPPEIDAKGVAPALAGVRGHHMAKAALEMAVLDAELQAAGVSLAANLGATADTVEAGVAVGIVASVPELLDAVAAAVDEGYRRVKLKIGPGWDVEPVQAVRERFGDDLLLQADANATYRLDDAAHLARLDPFDLALIEQPIGADDLVGHAALARRIATPLCLDESITSADVAATAIALGATAVVNVKPSRVGGYLEARRVHDVCRAAGIPVWCGGLFETGLARRANLALAALPGFSLPGDVSPPSRYLAADIVGPLLAPRGRVRVPDQPGIGAAVLEEAVAAHTVELEHLPVDR